jgi:hypothetical protein
MATKKQETKKPAQAPAKDEKALAPVMPDYMKQFIEQSKADTGSLMSSSVSVPRLSYRGKVWRFIVDGEEEKMKGSAISVIIVGVEPVAGRFIKTLYLSQYTPGDTSPPDCSSSNGIGPDSWVNSPQAQRCNQCPKNVFGSAQSRTGGKAKACHDSKRLWVIKPDDAEVVYGLNVPIMSLKNLAEYGKYIARNNFPLALVLTELSMDDDSEFPKLCFKHVGFVEEDMSKEAIELNQTRPWSSISTPALSYDGPGNTLALPPGSQSSGPGAPAIDVKPERKQGGEGVDKILGQWEK